MFSGQLTFRNINHNATTGIANLEIWLANGATATKCFTFAADGSFHLQEGTTTPAALAGYGKLYIDTSDGHLKVIFSNGTIKTIATNS